MSVAARGFLGQDLTWNVATDVEKKAARAPAQSEFGTWAKTDRNTTDLMKKSLPMPTVCVCSLGSERAQSTVWARIAWSAYSGQARQQLETQVSLRRPSKDDQVTNEGRRYSRRTERQKCHMLSSVRLETGVDSKTFWVNEGSRQ